MVKEFIKFDRIFRIYIAIAIILSLFLPCTTGGVTDNNPPNQPSDPFPADYSTQVSVDSLVLSWTCSDPNGDDLTFDIYFGTTSPPSLVWGNYSTMSYTSKVDPLDYSTPYFWKIIAKDGKATTESDLWKFTTEGNSRPYTPSNPYPSDSATDVPIDVQLSWSGGDPNPSDMVTYGMFLVDEPHTGFTIYDQNIGPYPATQTTITYDLGTTLDYDTTYKWSVSGRDGLINSGYSTWYFTTLSNQNNPPNQPSNPSPSDNAVNVDIDADLSWFGGDPDIGDTVTYDVYFGTGNPPPKIVSNQSETSYNPGTLNYVTMYYWKIVAWDDNDISNEGPVWDFITEADIEEPEDQLIISTSSSVSEGQSFQVIVTAGGIAVEDAMITFTDNTYYTDVDGQVLITAPLVEEDTSFDILVSKTGYVEMTTTINVVDVPDIEDQKQLVIISPSSVNEGDSFEITITANDNPIDDVKVTFDNAIYFTDLNGKAILNAPNVDYNTFYTLTAEKTDYLQTSVTVTIVNNEGIIYGNVTNTTGALLQDAKVCVSLSDVDNVETKSCVLTDTNGYYMFTLPAGAYTIQASKNGYEPVTKHDIVVIENQYTLVDFELQKKEDEEPETHAEYTIDDKIKKGTISVEVDAREETDIGVSLFTEDIEVVIENAELQSEEGLSLLVSADEDTPGAIFSVYIGQIENLEDIVVKLDGNPIQKSDNIRSFFNLVEEGKPSSDEAQWILLYSENDGKKEAIVLAYIPHFSEHQLTITAIGEIIEFISKTTTALFYIAIISITILVLIFHEKFIWKT